MECFNYIYNLLRETVEFITAICSIQLFWFYWGQMSNPKPHYKARQNSMKYQLLGLGTAKRWMFSPIPQTRSRKLETECEHGHYMYQEPRELKMQRFNLNTMLVWALTWQIVLLQAVNRRISDCTSRNVFLHFMPHSCTNSVMLQIHKPPNSLWLFFGVHKGSSVVTVTKPWSEPL